MRFSMQEPTGIWVHGADGETVLLSFPAFVAAIEDGAVLADDAIWSHIVTDGKWIRAGDMRLFQMLTVERQVARQAAACEWPQSPLKEAAGG